MSSSSSDDAQILETKVVILGHTGVGKTSMLNQFVRRHFPINTTATIGAAFMRKTIKINNWQVALQIWDTAGQERFRSMAPMYYRGAQAAVLVYDVTQPATLEKVHSWVEELQGHTSGSLSATGEVEDIVMVVAGNKADLRENKPAGAEYVDQDAAKRYATSIHASLFETSAKTGKGVDALFEDLARTLLERHLASSNAGKNELQFKGAGSVKPNDTNKSEGGGCCS